MDGPRGEGRLMGTGKGGVASTLSSLGRRKPEQTRALSTKKLFGRQGDEKYDMTVFLNPMLVCICKNKFHPQTRCSVEPVWSAQATSCLK